ncbi:MAG: hypothetical protein E6Q56_01205 [Mycobacterium sp.]|nr:MAG: hypothetical protein E6Q56_01205 [Mycobacterium sp.]
MATSSIAASACLLLMVGCSSATKSEEKSQAPSATTSSSATSTTSTSTSTSTSTETSSPTGTAMPDAAKEAFCRDVNTAVNIFEAPGTQLSDTQTTDMINALESASKQAPGDVPGDLTAAITTMLADLQGLPGSNGNLPPSFSENGRNMANYVAGYCG